MENQAVSWTSNFTRELGRTVTYITKLWAWLRVVSRLSDTSPKDKNCKLRFDHYFTDISLLRKLEVYFFLVYWGAIAYATAEQMKSRPRGKMGSKVSGKKDIYVSRWLDNEIVTLASTFAGVGLVDQERRWNEFAKKHIMVDRPFLLMQTTTGNRLRHAFP